MIWTEQMKNKRQNTRKATINKRIITKGRGKSHKVGNHRKNNINEDYLNFLRHCSKSSTRGEVIRTAPQSVIKTICNAAFNTQYNPIIRLTPAQRKILAKHRRKISFLTDRHKTLQRKRKLLQNHGALPF